MIGDLKKRIEEYKKIYTRKGELIGVICSGPKETERDE